jgi:hypothetical protein
MKRQSTWQCELLAIKWIFYKLPREATCSLNLAFFSEGPLCAGESWACQELAYSRLLSHLQGFIIVA